MKKLIALVVTAAMVLTLAAPALAAELWDGYPGPDELEVTNTIPDPFKFFDTTNDPTGDGYVSSPEEWSARREEIKDLIQRYWYGYKWPTAAKDVSGYTEVRDDPNTASFRSGWSTATVNLGDAFSALLTAIQSDGVKVGDTAYGPETDAAAAQALAIEAWNAGYTVTQEVSFWGTTTVIDCRLVDQTGPIDADSIPTVTIPVAHQVIAIQNPELGTKASFDITVTIPSDEQRIVAWGNATDPVPVMIGIGGTFSAAALLEAGYGIATFSTGVIYPDKEGGNGNENRDGVYTTLYPYDPTVYEYSSGSQMAWAWAVSQIITALENPSATQDAEGTFGQELGLDPTRVGVTGHSRNGQTSIVAAAFDERIDVCLPSEPATGSYRYKVEGKIFNWNVSYYPAADRVYGKTGPASNGLGGTWFSGAADVFKTEDGYRELLLPFDPSDLISLVAPRPYFVVSGIHQHWQGNEGIVAIVNAAAEVYDYIGTTEIEKNNIGIRARESSHSFYYNFDIPFAIAILDREFKQDASDTTLHVQDLYPDGNSAQNMSYPAKDYATIRDMTSHPFEIASAYMPWSSPNKYMLWTAQDNFLINQDVTITVHSDAPDVDLYTPAGIKIDAASHDGEIFTFAVAANQAVYGRYELRTDGADKENRSVYFSAVSLSDALRHGTTKGDEGEENRVLGFSSRLANTEQDPPVVYINGKATDMNFTSNRTPKAETTLFGYGIQFHDKLFTRIANEGWDETGTFGVKNLKFVTLPEYTFEFSMADIYASAENNGKEGAANFVKAISWPVERYNNGEAEVWPPVPYGPEERAAYEAGKTVSRPEGPEAWTTDFDAQIVETRTEIKGTNLIITLKFSEALNKGEYAFGLDAASSWNTAWNEAGDELSITLDRRSIDAQDNKINLIVFRLMDLEGNLIGGPIQLEVEIPEDYATIDVAGMLNRQTHDAYVNGYPDGTIRPEANITRAEVAAMFYGILTDEAKAEYATRANSFTDVKAGSWYEEAVSTLSAIGVISGYKDGSFKPGQNITRAEFAAIAAKFAAAQDESVTFTDVGKHWAGKSISLVAANGWVTGYKDGTFLPNQNITRAEAMSIINRMLERNPQNADDLSDTMTQWIDNQNAKKWYYLAIQEATNSHDYTRTEDGFEVWADAAGEESAEQQPEESGTPEQETTPAQDENTQQPEV